MLKNIKSSYFIKKIFSYLDEGQKLKVVKYNKRLQENIKINIINYKFYSGIYIIYVSNRFIKAYFGADDSLIYEGEYLNGKRHGKGKEYNYKGQLKFEGEYLNGKINGKGKEYSRGKLRFEGEYLNGKRHGKGKEYDWNDILRFEGEYINDKKWIGIGYDSNGNISYKLNNNINGKNKEYHYNNKLLFEGEYINGEWNGKGKEYYLDGKLLFEGEYLS